MALRYYQREAIDAIFEYWRETPGHPLVDMATGCHAAGTQILMFDGSTKPVELVAANDNLMGPDSKPRRVLRTVSGREMMYRVTPVKGEPFVVNEGHILSLKTTGEGEAKTKYPGGLHKGGVVIIAVRDWLQKAKYWKHCRKLWRTGVDFDFPANDNLPVPAYIVGAMLGDGSLQHQPGLTNMDHEVIDEVCGYAKSLGVRARFTQKPNNRAFGIFFSDDDASKSTRNRFVAALDEAGVWGMVCHEKRIPQQYKAGSKSTRLEVLAGLLDTDGHLSDRSHFDFISKSEALSRDVVFVARSLGLAAYVTPCEKFCQTGGGGTYWRVSISGDVDTIPNRVERQKATPRKQKKNPLVTGFKIEAVGVGDYYGFALDGDHLYLTADFTVHHNTGKSITMATLTQELVEGWPGMRVLNVAHREELVEGNFGELVGIWPFAPAGIYAASLGRRDRNAQIIFGQIQTIYNKADEICGVVRDSNGNIVQSNPIDVLEIDEVHLVPRDAETMYGQFIAALLAINPDMKIVGFTATIYRLDSGRLDEGDGRMFDKVVYTYSISQGIEDGFLAPLSSKGMEAGFDLTGVGTLGGDYKKGALAAAVDKEEITRLAVAEAVAYGANRRTALFFCSGVEHAEHVRDEVRRHGKTCEIIHGNTPKGERRKILQDYKAGRIWGVSNDAVLTVGTNVPGIDLIADLAPTKSTSRYVQKAGRGTRPVYPAGFNPDAATAEERRAAIASGPKPNCLYLDYAKNVSYHGPVDMVQPRVPGKGDGSPPVKQCPQDEGGCGELVHISVMVCPCCGKDFPPSEEVKITAKADDVPILSKAEATWRPVTSRTFRFHEGKPDSNGGTKPPSVKVTFMSGMTAMNTWLCPQHEGYARSKADRWWVQHGGLRPFPRTVLEWLERQNELLETAEISVEPNGRYWNVKDCRAGTERAANDNEQPADNDNYVEHSSAILDGDYIPF